MESTSTTAATTATALALAVATALLPTTTINAADTQPLGSGSYLQGLPDGASGPSNTDGNAVTPRVTVDFAGAIPTNTWWSSLLWERWPGNTFGQPMHAHPLSMQAESHGLMIGHLADPYATGVGYQHTLSPSTIALHIGPDGLNAGEVRVADATDWTVTADWSDGSRSMQATFGRGLPLVRTTCTGADPVMSVEPTASNWWVIEADNTHVILHIDGQTWGLFASDGAVWTQTDRTFTATGTNTVSVGVLPDASAATIALFKTHALVDIVDTRVSWTWNPQQRTVDVDFEFDAVDLYGAPAATLACLYRHQYLNGDAGTVLGTYPSPRGELRLVSTDGFTIPFPAPAIVPLLPNVSSVNTDWVQGELDAILASGTDFPSDTYWCGKIMGRHALLAMIADQLGDTDSRDILIADLKEVLESWLSVGTTSGPSATAPLQSGDASATKGVVIETVDGASGPAATGMGGGDWVRFDNIEFPSSTPFRSMIRFASDSGGSGMVRVRLDAVDGPVVAEAALGSTGGWTSWNETAMGLLNTDLLSGVHDVWVVCESTSNDTLLTLDWFQFEYDSAAGADRVFAMDPTWDTLIGYPASYGADTELNDHHFHYGYFVMAASVVARFDPDWASNDAWGAMIDLLIADAANWNRDDKRFCLLRNMEPYVGYSYAAGHAGFAAGNNQESSSESLHFASACVMWGETTGRTEVRDLGLFLLAVESAAVDQYWFDVDEVVFPPEMSHPVAGIVWDSGADYATWWTANPEEIHGINVLPTTGGSLYLGRRPDAMQRLWNHLLEQNGGNPVQWRDILWCWRALADPAHALSLLLADPGFPSEPGTSRAHTVHWITALSGLGLIDSTVAGDAPLSAVFIDDGVRTYVAHNAGAGDLDVSFDDGTNLCVPAGSTAWSYGDVPCDAIGDVDGDGDVDIDDLTGLIAAWGACGGSCPADLDGDASVTVVDLLLLLQAWP